MGPSLATAQAIKTLPLDDQTVYHLKVGTDKVTTLVFPQYPEMVSQIDQAEPFTRTLYRGFEVVLTKVYRFDAEDTLIFQVEFVNETDQPIYYVPQSLAVRVGPAVCHVRLFPSVALPPSLLPVAGRLPAHALARFQ